MRRTAFVVLAIAVIFIAAVIWVYSSVATAGSFQRDVRSAQLARSQTLNLQLDEETGVRGFALTRERRFLEPYFNAMRLHPTRFADLENALHRIKASREALAAAYEERRLHDRWVAEIASLLIRNPGRVTAQLLESRGKDLIDEFRRQNGTLLQILSDASSAADEQLRLSLLRIAGVATALLLGFVAMVLAFSRRQSELEDEVAEQRRLYEIEKRISDTLQEAFTQRTFPESPTLGLHAVYIPATEDAKIGGDWYDAFAMPDGRVLFSIGDVAGHGLEAAVSMSRVRQAIIATALYERDPSRVLRYANGALMLQETGMVTALCGYVDPATLEITYASAGHPPPILAQPGMEPVFLESGGPPLGVIDDAVYTTTVSRGCDRALLVLYTDGAIEYTRDVIEGERRLIAAVRAGVDGVTNPAVAIRERIFSGIRHADDVAIMTISFRETGVAAAGSSAETLLAPAPNAMTGTLRFGRMPLRGRRVLASARMERPRLSSK